MSKSKSPKKTLTLNGSQISVDDKILELVEQFKQDMTNMPEIPVTLDLSTINTIYSKGIALILGLFKECKAANRGFTIRVSSDDIVKLFKMLKLDKVISIEKVEQ